MNRTLFKIAMIILSFLTAVIPFFGSINYNNLPVDFQVESVNDVYVPTDKNSTVVSEYPTIIKLSHQKNKEDNGKLLVAFEHWGSTYPVYKSDDDGAYCVNGSIGCKFGVFTGGCRGCEILSHTEF